MMPVPAATRPAGPVGPVVATSRWARLGGLRLGGLRLGGLPWRPVLLSFLVSRAVVLAALGLAQLLHRHDGDLRTEGLLGWDADWYDRIATSGYTGLPPEALRFFPLLPLLARLLAPLLLGSAGAALLLLSNAAALVFALLLHRLVLREGLGRRVADAAVWVAALGPASFVLVMGYTEPLYAALVCGLLLAVRDRRWAVVAAVGLLAGLLRPPGVLLALVVVVEALRGAVRASWRERAARLVAVAAPVLGLATYLLYARARFGDALLPFRAQTRPDLRGGTFVDPAPGVARALRGLLHGELAGAGLHVLWAVLALGLLVVVARRLPLSHLVLAATTVLLAATARDMTSFERYAGGAVPLLVAAALVVVSITRARPATRRSALPSGLVRSTTIGTGAAVLAAYSTFAFLHLYVP